MPEASFEAERTAIGSGHIAQSMDLGLLSAEGNWTPSQIEPILTLGKGRAARAVLARARDAAGNDRLCVEKVFAPGLLTRVIYRCAFQSPFAYQASADAILACFYRRRTAAALVQALIPEAAVAEPLYVRWDAESRAHVLAIAERIASGRLDQALTIRSNRGSSGGISAPTAPDSAARVSKTPVFLQGDA